MVPDPLEDAPASHRLGGWPAPGRPRARASAWFFQGRQGGTPWDPLPFEIHAGRRGRRGSSIRLTSGVRFSPAPAPCQTRRGPCMGQEARGALRVVPNSGSRRLCRPRPVPSSRSSACDASKPQLTPADPAHAAGLCELPSCGASGAPGSFRRFLPGSPALGCCAVTSRPPSAKGRARRKTGPPGREPRDSC